MAAAICAALYKRDRTGVGDEITINLYHTAVWIMCNDIQAALVGNDAIRNDRTNPSNPLWNSYRTKDDRWFWMAMLQSITNWPNFCKALGRQEMENDPKFATMEARSENNKELVGIIDEIMATRTMEEWIPIFKKHNLIYGKVQKPI
jgi:crotonobetainyl-CoA:carnitine CoA-transferase CaiB-like acyl-CoA transferase